MTPQQRARRLDGYVRVSKVGGREGESFISTADQRQRIEAATRAAGGQVGEWITDLDESGGSNERPGLERALGRVEAGESDGIVVAKLDRFARSVAGAGRALERLEQAGGVLVAADLGLDTSTPSGKLMRNVLMALAEFELERVRENWTVARSFAARRGVAMAKPLTGYDRGPDGVLIPNRDAASITAMFQMRGAGANLSELGRFLDTRGVQPSNRPAKTVRWSSASVASLLRNRGYMGEVRAGDVVNSDAHPALVTLAEFEAAQAARGASVVRSLEPALLAGLIRCESCRHIMKPKRSDDARAYRCGKTHTTGTCPAPAAIRASVIEPFVVKLLLSESGPLRFRPTAVTSEIEEAEREVEQARAELHAYVEAASALDREAFAAGAEARQRRLAVAEERRRSLFATDAANLPSPAELAHLWADLPISDRRHILGAAFDALVIRPAGGKPGTPVEDRVIPILHGDGPTDLPGRGRRVAFKPFDLPEVPRIATA